MFSYVGAMIMTSSVGLKLIMFHVCRGTTIIDTTLSATYHLHYFKRCDVEATAAVASFRELKKKLKNEH